jgi:hypothetical protein
VACGTRRAARSYARVVGVGQPGTPEDFSAIGPMEDGLELHSALWQRGESYLRPGLMVRPHQVRHDQATHPRRAALLGA